MITKLDFKIFQKEDYSEYLEWFQDNELNRRLGPMEEDDEWLGYILNQKDRCTYSIFINKKLVGVIGIEFPKMEYSTYCITNIAVKPFLRGSGIGREILNKTIELHPLQDGQFWNTYIDKKNPKAKSFFESNGWKKVSKQSKNNEMILMEYRVA